jgi:repressor LexA
MPPKKILRSLTLKEKNVLVFLESYMLENGISPSYQEICSNFGFASYNSVQRYLKQLESKGYIALPGGNQKRAITLLKTASSLQDSLEGMQKEQPSVVALDRPLQPEAVSVQMMGRVAAGAPIEAFDHDEFIDVPSSMVRFADRTFALRVQGQSMVDDGILDGDVILVQKQDRADNGDIIVAVVDNEATVKRIYQKPSQTELRPANSTMQSMWFQPGQVQVRGLVVGLIRQF